jgi:hypothetical protein
VVDLEKASRQRLHYRDGFERRHLGKDYTIVVDLKKGIAVKIKVS